MIVNEKIEVKITRNNLEYYESLGYKPILGELLTIKNSDLTKGSHIKVKCLCDYCGSENQVIFKNYILNTKINGKYCCKNIKCSNKKIIDVNNAKYGVDNIFQLKETKEKSKKTCLEHFGVEHQMFIQYTKDKIKKTCFEKYGVDHPMYLEKYKEKTRQTNLERYGVEYLTQSKEYQLIQKEKRIKNGKRLPDDKIEPFILYRRNVDNLTDRNKKVLFENWDGYDYYDNEYIKDNLKNKVDKNYPSIDHKISVYYGFINNISFEDIANIDNLCITKISNNCKKWCNCEKEYKEKSQ
jgi:hypothetical protein